MLVFDDGLACSCFVFWAGTNPCAEISRETSPGLDRRSCMSEQRLEEVFTFRVAVYRPDDKTTKCFLSTGGNRRFRPLAQGYRANFAKFNPGDVSWIQTFPGDVSWRFQHRDIMIVRLERRH